MSLRAPSSNRRDQMRAREQRNAFARAKEMFARIRAANGDIDQLAKIGAYRSRGKGRGTPMRRHGNRPGKYSPHQGGQECMRRQVGGWANAKRLAGTTKRMMMTQDMEL